MPRLNRDFFARDTLAVARDLLGQRLVRVVDGQRLSGRIVEVEAYIGESDQASHARFGLTQRNAPMYGAPGHAYVYFVYGMHHCLNTVTDSEGFPAAVLIRALEPVEGIEQMREWRGGVPDRLLTGGPARLCQALNIDLALNGIDLCAVDAPLFLEAEERIADADVVTGPRVGIRGDDVALRAPWRFSVRGNLHVSR